MGMREYAAKLKNICDMLQATGSNIYEFEQVLYLLNGLRDEYDVVVAIITSQKVTPPLDDVHAMLLSHEERIGNKNSNDSDLPLKYAASNKGIGQNNNRVNLNN